MSQKANPRSRGKRAGSNRLAVESIIRDAERMVNRDRAEPEAVRAFLLANVGDLVALAGGRSAAEVSSAIVTAPAIMFVKHALARAATPAKDGESARPAEYRTDDSEIPLPRWRVVDLFGSRGREALDDAKDAAEKATAGRLGPMLCGPDGLDGMDADGAFVSVARLRELCGSLRSAWLALKVGEDTDGKGEFLCIERARLAKGLAFAATARIVRDEPRRIALGVSRWRPTPDELAEHRQRRMACDFTLRGPVQQIPGRAMLVLEWGAVGRMRFWGDQADGPSVIVPLEYEVTVDVAVETDESDLPVDMAAE